MKISVIMPCYNCGPWVQEALRSIAAQTYQPHEIIVIDDGSTDNTVERVTSSGIDVRLVRGQYGNAAAARNAGIRQASGDVLAFLDADDTWYPGHLQLAVTQLRQTKAILWFGSYDILYGAKTLVNDWWGKHVLRKGVKLEQEEFEKVIAATNGQGFATGNIVSMRERIVQVGAFDESQVRRHDIDLFMRAVCGQKWVYSGQPTWLYQYRNDGNISSNIAECAYYHLRALSKNVQTLHPSTRGEVLHRAARNALGIVLRNGTYDNRMRTWQLASPWLGKLEACGYRAAISRPGVFILLRDRLLKRLGTRWRQRTHYVSSQETM